MSQFNYDDALFGVDESARRLRDLIQSHKSLSLKIRQELWDIIHDIDACSSYFHELKKDSNKINEELKLNKI